MQIYFLVLALFLLAGCGSDGTPSDETGSSASASSSQSSLASSSVSSHQSSIISSQSSVTQSSSEMPLSSSTASVSSSLSSESISIASSQSSSTVSEAAESSSSHASYSSLSSENRAIERLSEFAAREHGYSNFDTTVIDSETALDAFINAVQIQESWNDKEAFLDAANTLDIDFTKENLMLFRHTEGSGSIAVTPQEPQIEDAIATVVIERDVPEVGTADMAYYVFAYRVAKTITEVDFVINGAPVTVSNQEPTACTAQYEPVCADLQVVCVTTPCDPVPTTYDNLCLMQNDPNALYRHDGECDAGNTDRSVMDPAAIVRSTEQFGNALMGQYLDPTRNLFLSPFSIISALSMTYAGAYAQSADEFETLFHYEANLSVHRSYEALLPQLTPEHNDFSVANSIWPRIGYPFYPAFLSTVTRQYGSAVFPTDYMNDPTANKTINAWVEEQTNDKIENLLPNPLPDSTAMVLVNAVYFKGSWITEFDENATETAPFHRADESTVDAEMMFVYSDFNYTSTDLFQAIEMPYAAREFSMVVLLPRAGYTLQEIQTYLLSNSLASIVDSMYTIAVELTLPKFKIEWGSEDITPTLQQLGLISPFSFNADFRLMADLDMTDTDFGRDNLFISQVFHKTFVEVSEKGTEAAAATAVVVSDLASEGPPPTAFKADRPFLFYIRHNATGLILFSGLLADPS